MKILLDTENKVITLQEPVNLGELFTWLDNLLPLGEWKSYKLDTNVINSTIYPSPQPWKPNQPWYEQPWITYDTNTDPNITNITSGDFVVTTEGNSYSINSGTYLIDI